MKMKMWKRIATMAFSVLTLALMGLYALEAFGCGYADRIYSFMRDEAGKYISLRLALVLAAFALIAIICALIFLMAARGGRTKTLKMLKLSDEKGDHVLLEQETLDALVLASLGAPEGVSDIKIGTAYTDDRLEIMIDVAVESSINIPDTTRVMLSSVRNQVYEISGIRVDDVSVRISTIKIPEDYEPLAKKITGAPLSYAPQVDEDAQPANEFTNQNTGPIPPFNAQSDYEAGSMDFEPRVETQYQETQAQASEDQLGDAPEQGNDIDTQADFEPVDAHDDFGDDTKQSAAPADAQYDAADDIEADEDYAEADGDDLESDDNDIEPDAGDIEADDSGFEADEEDGDTYEYYADDADDEADDPEYSDDKHDA